MDWKRIGQTVLNVVLIVIVTILTFVIVDSILDNWRTPSESDAVATAGVSTVYQQLT